MKLVVFDLDGTLTQTVRVDETCFILAFQEALGVHVENADWAAYTHCTDSNLTLEILQRAFGRAPTRGEVERHRRRFLHLLDQAWQQDPQQYVATAGAALLLERLRTESEWAVAIATGGWPDSAGFKLEVAGLPRDLPIATAEDGLAREAIVDAAIARARSYYGQDGFTKTVSVGDGLWDVRTAVRLGLPFLGIGGEPRAGQLRRAGAGAVFADMSDGLAFVQGLEHADPPRLPGPS